MKVIAGCVVRNAQGQYLLIEEKQERVRGLWNIPAGYADEGEGPERAAVRETREEVGLEVTIDPKPLYVYDNNAKQKRYVAYRAMTYSGEIMIQETEILSARWVEFDEIVSMHDAKLFRDEWIFKALSQAEHEDIRP